MSDDCIFCQIIDGRAPCYHVHETRYTRTFLDIFPAAPGHCLIVTKNHYTDIACGGLFSLCYNTFVRAFSHGHLLRICGYACKKLEKNNPIFYIGFYLLTCL